VIDLQKTPQWIAIRAIVIDELRDHPEVVRRIMARFKALDADPPAGNGHAG
jgi:hypothetical protein